MKGLKLFAAGAAATGLLGLASAGHAADTVVFAGAGSSALWKGFEQSALSSFPNHYSAHNGASIVDGASTEKGDIWIAWDNGASGNINIAYYIKVDSTVGDRAYFKSDTLTITNPAPAADNTGYPGAGDVQPPSEVLVAVNAAAINVGVTDITPADAKVATARSIKLGYGLLGSSTKGPIQSSYDTSTATPIDFNIAARAFTLVPIGASPIIVFVNKTDTATGGFGAIPTSGSSEFRANVNRFTLAGFLSGQFGRTRDLISDPTLNPPTGTVPPAKAVTTILREPLSGTYNTMEYCIPESLEVSGFTGGNLGGQELGITTNPVNQSSAGGTRKRAIGTGQSISNANSTTNALGYAFWSFSNFSSAPNLRYLTVDGADPLFDSYATFEGSLQPGATPNFRNIRNGGYPIWSLLRAVTTTPTPAGVTAIITGLPAGDFVKASELEVFRSYHATPDFPTPSNGNFSGTTPTGGDVGGAVFPINADIDFVNDNGAELVNLKQ